MNARGRGAVGLLTARRWGWLAALCLAAGSAPQVAAQLAQPAPMPTPIAEAPPAAAPGDPAGRAGFYRFPALRGHTLVFTAEGDLWRLDLARGPGGQAERLTTHPDLESRPALSPDGRWLAFNAAYERAAEAYVMPQAGGLPQRLTWQGQNPRVLGFTPAGEVLLAAPALRGQPVTQLLAVDPATQAQRVLPVGQASDGALSADGQTLYFTRRGLRSDNSRGYRGGAMPGIWVLNLAGNAEARPLLPAGFGAGHSQPLPYSTPQGARVAFLADRDGRQNLYSVAADGSDLRQHTRHRAWDIRSAAIDGSRVVYALGADLWLLDLAAPEAGPGQRLDIRLGGEADLQRQRWLPRAQASFTSAALAPDGRRALLNLRGRLVTQGAGPLRRAELPVPADARCRDGVFSHDSRHVYALCDIAPGPAGARAGADADADALPEAEIWRFEADGSGSPLQVTRGATLRRLGIQPSPDGRWLAHGDRAGRIWLTDIRQLPARGGLDSKVVDSPVHPNRSPQVQWAPDSQAFVFARAEDAAGPAGVYRDSLFLHHLPSGQTLPLTSGRYDSSAPAFTPDGRWLFFLSERHFASLNPSPWGDRNFGPYFDRRSRVYALALQPLQPPRRWPFLPPDELQAEAPAPAGPAELAAASRPAPAPAPAAAPRPGAPGAAQPASPRLPAIELAGLAGRLFEVPASALPPGNYSRLATDGKRLFFLETDTSSERRSSLRSIAIDNLAAPPETYAPEVLDFEISPDGKRMLLQRRAASGPQPGDLQLLDVAAKPPSEAAALARSQVRWADMPLAADPVAEWRQMFHDAWRLHRDHFYDPSFHGVDWPAQRRKYAALLPRVGERGELNELLAQMVSELSALHSQVFTPDVRRGPDDIAPAGLGAVLQRVAAGFRVEHIYRSDPELPSEASPLRQAGVQVGDVITHFNGRSLAAPGPGEAHPGHQAGAPQHLHALLRGQAGRQVLLGLQSAPGAGPGPARRVVLQPHSAAREAQLRMGDWEAGNRERAAQRSQGRVGYLRLRAMGADDIASFAREFYAQLDQPGLVIDVRGNNGGNIDSWVIEKLLRRAWAWWQPRHPEGAPPYPNMQQAWRGHLVVLVDENTYSDGETFAAGVQRLGLGPLVGLRSSGAGVWLSDTNRLADGGLMRAAELGQFTPEDGWIIEGRGVQPDIEVDNPPRASAGGADAQLDTAVDWLLRRLAEDPRPLPRPPGPPRPPVAPLAPSAP